MSIFKRRTFLASLATGLFTTPGAFAEQLLFPSPPMTEGPFYPDQLPLDQDNDLLIINDNITPAVGQISHLIGRILDTKGNPIKNATIEIWQCDAKQVYLHTADSGPKKEQQDSNFQGFGRFETATDGRYRFRTIKPVPYPGRPSPHIHFKVKQGGRDLLTSQLFIRGHEGNAQDGVFLANDLLDRELMSARFTPIPDSKLNELACQFDIVVGRTPDERQQ